VVVIYRVKKGLGVEPSIVPNCCVQMCELFAHLQKCEAVRERALDGAHTALVLLAGNQAAVMCFYEYVLCGRVREIVRFVLVRTREQCRVLVCSGWWSGREGGRYTVNVSVVVW
jgi:hypothetical protein